MSAVIEELGTGSGPSIGFPRAIESPSFPIAEQYPKGSSGEPRVFKASVAFPALGHAMPAQKFTERLVENRRILKNEPNGKWPSLILEIPRDAADSVPTFTDVRAESADDSVEAWLLLSRLMFLLAVSETFVLIEDGGRERALVLRETDPSVLSEVRNLSSIVRKLRYIEGIFNEQFSIPDRFSPHDVIATEKVFRGLTQGEFTLRSDVITLRRLDRAKLSLAEPPFTRPGVFSRRVEGALEETSIELLGRRLYLGPYTIVVKQAEIGNRRGLDRIESTSHEKIDIRFVVYDNQVSYSFDNYLGRKDRRISRDRFLRFKKALEVDEPKDLVDLVDESLQGEVSVYEAIQIASGFLQYHDFPDRYCAQEPVLEPGDRKWRVPIHLAYADGRGGPVGELVIDLKTGVIDRHTPAEVMLADGRALAKKLLNAR
jgi:hypothetical protein